MKTLRFALATVAILALVAVAFGQTNGDIYKGLAYDKSTETKITGEVTELQDFNCPISKQMGNHIIVKTADGASIVVHVAPVKFMKDYGVEIAKGSKVEVVGSKLKDSNGAVTMLAREITSDNNTLRFRDDKGKPIW